MNPGVDGDEMSMDMTRAVGAILRQAPRFEKEGSELGDATMDLTMAVGAVDADAQSTTADDEELTMELTTVVGGVLARAPQSAPNAGRQSLHGSKRTTRKSLGTTNNRLIDVSVDDEMEMDMTVAVGGILPPAQSVQPDEDDDDDQTMDMDVTTAMGKILPSSMRAGTRSQAKLLMERETDSGQLTSSPFQEQVGKESASKMPARKSDTSMAPPASPAASRKTRSSAKPSFGLAPPTTPRSATKHALTPVKKLVTPSKQITPVPTRPTTPGKTPPSKNIQYRSASPKKLFKEELQQKEVTPKPTPAKRLFAEEDATGRSAPSVVLPPRRASGVGANRVGMGSPRVAALLDRRRSLSDDTKVFTPTQAGREKARVLRFEDDHAMRAELHQARETVDLPEPTEEKDATLNLREMIQSLTPKKKSKPRKSLHVGAARGILGKRPVELDEDEEEDDSPKRLKNLEGSPVKNVFLPPPPSKIETKGRSTRATRQSEGMSSNSEYAANITTTPKRQDHSMASRASPGGTDSRAHFDSVSDANDESSGQAEESFEKIHLQDFLNLTSIRFMELTTTKRRHTVLQKPTITRNSDADNPTASGLERCVVAGACTVPMLELYQHSCRELKKYISEGRTIVREIETDTLEENPPLFREYMSATPDVKFIMDNQFKNVKTHARLLSKAMWYEWRMKLLDGLKEGLYKMKEGMDGDEKVLSKQEKLLAPVLPVLCQEHERLTQEHAALQLRAEELANCDQEELRAAREKIVQMNSDMEAKRAQLAEMQVLAAEKESRIVKLLEQKAACEEDIKAAEKVREECRGWTLQEVKALKGQSLLHYPIHEHMLTLPQPKSML